MCSSILSSCQHGHKWCRHGRFWVSLSPSRKLFRPTLNGKCGSFCQVSAHHLTGMEVLWTEVSIEVFWEFQMEIRLLYPWRGHERREAPTAEGPPQLGHTSGLKLCEEVIVFAWISSGVNHYPECLIPILIVQLFVDLFGPSCTCTLPCKYVPKKNNLFCSGEPREPCG